MVPVIDRVTGEGAAYFAKLLNRSQLEAPGVREAVDAIIADVRARGDEAVLEYTRRFDGAELTPETMRVSEEEMDEACAAVSPEWTESLRRAMESIRRFHQRQVRQTFMDVGEGYIVGSRVIPLARVGVYAPGGRAIYPSSVLMNVIPAQVAGVKEIILCTPPGKDGKLPAVTLAAARMLGITEVYKVGGAQAVAAMALGTGTMRRVDKIVGPGNIYVALAKRAVFGYAGIDMVAGPSEVLVVADDSARADYVAADLLSQAEHDPLAAAILITPSRKLLEDVQTELGKQLSVLPKAEIARASLEGYGALIHVADMEEAVAIANDIAPEHLELSVAEPMAWLGKVRNAGAVFMGHYAPEPLGDYYAGPNHTLPTSGTARFSSPLSVEDFIKTSSVIYYTREALEKVYQDVGILADSEDLGAHARSVRIRFEEA